MPTSAPLQTEPLVFARLERLLRPASVALVGASANPQSLGGRCLANLRSFEGRLHLVNPGRSDIDGLTCHASIDALPEAADLAVLAVPADQVEGVVRQCADRGFGAVIVFAAGYAETGTEGGLAAQHRLAAVAASGGMRLVGPNCVGIASHDRGLRAAFAEFGALSARLTSASGLGGDLQAWPETGQCRIALVSQSGALALALSQAADRGVNLTHVLTCGNSADVDVADYLVALAEDSACDAIALVFEGLRDPSRLEPALDRAVLAGKRVAMCHIGRSMAGLEAIRFHTATSSPACLAAHPARRGIVSVMPIEALIETAVFLAKAPAAPADPLGAGVAVLSSSGGTGILAADAAERAGVALPQPGEPTLERLHSTLPAFAAARNPCDTTAQATRHPDLLFDAAEALLGDARYSALVLPWGQSQSAALLPRLGALGRAHGKPICIVWTGANLIPERVEAIERNPALALFRSLDACFTALAGWLRG